MMVLRVGFVHDAEGAGGSPSPMMMEGVSAARVETEATSKYCANY